MDPFNNHKSVPVGKEMADRQAPASICEAHKESNSPSDISSMTGKGKFPNPGPLGVIGDGTGKGATGR